MTDRESVRIQIASWIAIAALLFIMFIVAFSDEQRIMAFLFPAWLDRLVSRIPLIHNHGFAFVMITIIGIGPFMKWLKERKRSQQLTDD